jgi:preprotein translocase subunit YajC
VTQYFPFVLMVLAVLLFVLPARARKRVQAQAQAMQDSLTPGTPVMTTSGIHGTVAALGEGTVDLEIAQGVVVTFARQAILEVRTAAGPAIQTATDPGTPAGEAPGTPGLRPADGI